MEPDGLKLLARTDPILTNKSEAVIDYADTNFQKWIDDLILCGEENEGVGIAAPQVGKSIRLFIMAPKPNPRYPDAPMMEPTAILNPKFHSVSDTMEKGWEGCLSVPGFRGLVPRYTEIEVSYFDRNGIFQQQKFSGFLARLFQHEYDHLEGVLYPTQMEEGDELLTLEKFTALTGIVISS